MKFASKVFFIALIGLNTLFSTQGAEPDLLQNIESREKISLNGLWDIIIDPLENGYYGHRLTPKSNGYFMNAKMKSPSSLVE